MIVRVVKFVGIVKFVHLIGFPVIGCAVPAGYYVSEINHSKRFGGRYTAMESFL